MRKWFVICSFFMICLFAGINIYDGGLFHVQAATAQDFVNDARWKNGIAWNGAQGPKISGWPSSGCCAYVCDYVQYVYGHSSYNVGATYFTSVSEIRAGDVIHTGSHWFAVLGRSGNALYTAEGNMAGKVCVSSSRYTISGDRIQYYSDKGLDYYTIASGYHHASLDNTGPVYADFHVGELREGAFTVMAKITDPSGIKSVQYAIWTEKNGQDDLIWHDACCTDGNDYYWARIDFSQHNDERGKYIIHMYAYDNAGNLIQAPLSYTFDSEGPIISNVRVTNITSKGYTVTCKVVDKEMSVVRVQFPTWTVYNNQDDLVPEWWVNSKVSGKKSGDEYTFEVKSVDHNNETGEYITHIYAYDTLGNHTKNSQKEWSILRVNVHDHKYVAHHQLV